MKSTGVFLVGLCCLVSLNSVACGQEQEASVNVVQDWAQWRGPYRDGRFEGAQLPDKIDDTTLEKLWRIELGPSYSGPMVVGDRVFVTETKDQKSEVVRALDRKTGKQLWESEWTGSMQVPFFARDNGSWIRATPACDEGRLYVGGILDVLVCLDMEDGSQQWRIDFPSQTGSGKPTFGMASSPLVVGDAVYVQAGGAFYKLNKKTGAIIWKSLDDGGGMLGSAFSSPCLATIRGVEQMLVQTRESLNGVDLDDGSVLWSQAVPNFRGMNILTPVVFGDAVFTSSYKRKSFLYQLENNSGQWSVSTTWDAPKPAYMSTPVVRDNYVYMHLGNQRFTCMDLETGKTSWTSEPYGKYSSMILQDDKVLALDQTGELVMFRASPERFELLSQHRVSDQETWAHLAARGDELFVRELNAIAAFRFTGRE